MSCWWVDMIRKSSIISMMLIAKCMYLVGEWMWEKRVGSVCDGVYPQDLRKRKRAVE